MIQVIILSSLGWSGNKGLPQLPRAARHWEVMIMDQVVQRTGCSEIDGCQVQDMMNKQEGYQPKHQPDEEEKDCSNTMYTENKLLRLRSWNLALATISLHGLPAFSSCWYL